MAFGQYETLYKVAMLQLNSLASIWLGVSEFTATPLLGIMVMAGEGLISFNSA